jgi:hypothetical protein
MIGGSWPVPHDSDDFVFSLDERTHHWLGPPAFSGSEMLGHLQERCLFHTMDADLQEHEALMNPCRGY